MKAQLLFSLSLVLISAVGAQRGSYAGVRPISNGIKGPYPTEQNTGLSNRFGGDNEINGPPQPLPVDALGDAYLVNRISQLPEHQQPFWYLNYQHIEAHRNRPQNSGSVLVNRGSFGGKR